MASSTFRNAFENFMTNEQEVRKAIDDSTSASYSGSGYSVELVEDGGYQVLWNNNIGNLYVSPGLIIAIPKLQDDEIGEDGFDSFYDNAIEALRQNFEYAIDDLA